MNIGNKKWEILLIIVLGIGTGSYVFANSSLDSSNPTLNSDHSVKSDSQQSLENDFYDNFVLDENQEFNFEEIENMDIPDEELQILEDILLNTIVNNNDSEENGKTDTNGVVNSNIVNSTPNNANPELGSNVIDNTTKPSEENGTGTSGNTSSNATSEGSSSTNPEYNPGGNVPVNPEINPGNNEDKKEDNLNDNNNNNNNNDNNNNNNGNKEEENLDKEPGFIFENNGQFSTKTIIINDSNYDHMVIYNLNTGNRDETNETEYNIDMDYAIYVFIVWYKDGSYQGYKMYHV